ncbi:MAG: hypothetical protein Q4G26_05680 [Paracoccus sp. (in: a-proteobacteria)]|nr:hypothetical protein [Paracoccus sp. (in: a-proteobacteria)]
MTPEKLQALRQYCPPEVVRYVRAQDTTTTHSLFFPDYRGPVNTYSGHCHVAILDYVIDSAGASTSATAVEELLYEIRLVRKHISDDLRDRSRAALLRIAAREDGVRFVRLYSLAQLLDVDLREALLLHNPRAEELDPIEIDRNPSLVGYALYLASFGETAALDAYGASLRLRRGPTAIMRGLEPLFFRKPPGWEAVVRDYIDDPRQEMSQFGTPGMVVGQAAREMLGLPHYTGPRRLQNSIGEDTEPIMPSPDNPVTLRIHRYGLRRPPIQLPELLNWD